MIKTKLLIIMKSPYVVFIISDGTGLTAEIFSQSILAQFDISFRLIRKPFIDTLEKANEVCQEIDNRSSSSGKRSIVFTTLIKPEISERISKTDCFVINLFANSISQLESALGLKSGHVINRLHHNADTQSYKNRIKSINFSLHHDDGQSTSDLESAEIILVGVSRSGKTPTCLYLAVQFGLKAANYPITPDDMERNLLPKAITEARGKVFGLTIDPIRLSDIRSERYPNSRYSTLENCKYEIKMSETLMNKNNIPYLSTTNKSIEEISSSILQKINPEVITSSRI